MNVLQPFSQATGFTRAVFVSPEHPFEFYGGARMRAQMILRILLELFPEVELLCFDRASELTHGALAGEFSLKPSDLARLKVTRIQEPRDTLWHDVVTPFLPKIARDRSAEMEHEVRSRSHKGALIWFCRSRVAKYATIAHAGGAHVVVDTHQVESHLLLNRALQNVRGAFRLPLALESIYYERKFLAAADAIVVTSEIDASRSHRLIQRRDGAKVCVVPKSVDSDAYTSVRESPGDAVFFSGTLDYPENIEAITWFCNEIIPRLTAHASCTENGTMPRMIVAGSNPSPELEKLLIKNKIELHKNPRSILPLLAQAAVVVAPMLSGGGTRIKILEAMAAQRAVVSTGIGAQGLELAPSYDLEICEDPDGFTSAILRLLEDPSERRRLGENGLRTVQTRFDWKRCRPIVEGLLRSLA